MASRLAAIWPFSAPRGGVAVARPLCVDIRFEHAGQFAAGGQPFDERLEELERQGLRGDGNLSLAAGERLATPAPSSSRRCLARLELETTENRPAGSPG